MFLFSSILEQSYINMDRTYYASVENGHRNISINNIEKIANGFNISLTDLFKLVDEIHAGTND